MKIRDNIPEEIHGILNEFGMEKNADKIMQGLIIVFEYSIFKDEECFSIGLIDGVLHGLNDIYCYIPPFRTKIRELYEKYEPECTYETENPRELVIYHKGFSIASSVIFNVFYIYIDDDSDFEKYLESLKEEAEKYPDDFDDTIELEEEKRKQAKYCNREWENGFTFEKGVVRYSLVAEKKWHVSFYGLGAVLNNVWAYFRSDEPGKCYILGIDDNTVKSAVEDGDSMLRQIFYSQEKCAGEVNRMLKDAAKIESQKTCSLENGCCSCCCSGYRKTVSTGGFAELYRRKYAQGVIEELHKVVKYDAYSNPVTRVKPQKIADILSEEANSYAVLHKVNWSENPFAGFGTTRRKKYDFDYEFVERRAKEDGRKMITDMMRKKKLTGSENV